MAERKIGKVTYWRNLSSVLAIFRLMPQEGSSFPGYKAGQYIALRRDDCRLTRKIDSSDGKSVYGPDMDEYGNHKIGPVTHSYSISSAPYETQESRYLEFYIILEKDDEGHSGRLTESIFRIDLERDNQITYVERITGDFTLDKRAAGSKNVLLVGTGTGLAPFSAMIKQIYHDAGEEKNDGVSYTLLHTNRTHEELAYHEQFLGLDASRKFDFVYIPSVSRPTSRDFNDPQLGIGRANNLMRHIFEMPLKEEEDLQGAIARGENPAEPKAVLDRTVKPVLPKHFSLQELQKRFDPTNTVILTCGNPNSMADIKLIADKNRIRFEKEDW